MKIFNIIFASLFLSGIGFIALSSNNKECEAGLIFSHKIHTIDNGMACEDCHGALIESKTMSGDYNVKEEKCLECHEKNDDNCKMCHKDPKNPKFSFAKGEFPVIFNHNLHKANKMTCEQCHGNVASSTSLKKRFNPDMAGCMSCHQVTENINDCYLCHDKRQNLEPENHDAMWESNHGLFSSAGSEDCKSCHTDNFCINCHKGENLFAESHPPQFILTHSISFLARESDCFACHQDRTYCIDCHTKVNYVVPATHMMPSWKPYMANSSHIAIGRTNSEHCAVCHEQADPSCIGCHTGWKK